MSYQIAKEKIEVPKIMWIIQEVKYLCFFAPTQQLPLQSSDPTAHQQNLQSGPQHHHLRRSSTFHRFLKILRTRSIPIVFKFFLPNFLQQQLCPPNAAHEPINPQELHPHLNFIHISTNYSLIRLPISTDFVGHLNGQSTSPLHVMNWSWE